MEGKNNLKFYSKTIVIFLIFVLISVSSAYGGPTLEKQEQLNEYIGEYIKKLRIPGASVAISHNGELIYSEVFGEGIAKETKFYIGSTSKSFTALGIMQLHDEGKIDLEASVDTYIPEFKVSSNITVRNLLNHKSGMTENDYAMWRLSSDSSFSALVEDMNNITLSYSPGEKFSYFNQNYDLLGYIIERVSGISYEEYIEENILVPLRLHNTSVRGVVDTPGHLSFFGFSIKRSEPLYKYGLPAGYITSTAEDMVRYLEAIRMGKNETGVSKEIIDLMMSGEPYGMGLINSKVGNRPAVHHGGSLPGYVSNAIMLTEDNYSISVLLNKNHMINSAVFYPDLINGIVGILTGQETNSRISYFWIVRILFLVFILTIFLELIKLIKLLRNLEKTNIRKHVKAIIINLTIPLSLIIFLPIGAKYVFQRGISWHIGFLLMPDFITWLFIGIVFNFIRAAIHLVYVIKNYEKDRGESF